MRRETEHRHHHHYRPGDPGEAALREMLVRENELRLAPETQRAYERAERDGVVDECDGDEGESNCGGSGGDGEWGTRRFDDWLEVTDAVQRRVVREYISTMSRVEDGGGGGGRKAEGEEEILLRALRSATSWYPRLRDIPLYVRFNRARAGRLVPGDVLPDAALVRLSDGHPAGLLSLLAAHHHSSCSGIARKTAMTRRRRMRRRKTLIVAGSIS